MAMGGWMRELLPPSFCVFGPPFLIIHPHVIQGRAHLPQDESLALL
jgi:hypothetical protein